MSAEKLTIRHASPDDIDRVAEIYDEGRKRIGALGIDQWQDGYPARIDAEEDVKNGCLYIVGDGENIAAVATIVTGVEGDYEKIDGAWKNDGEYVTVHRIAVADGYTRRGLGVMIFSYAEALAHKIGCGSVRVDTHCGNIPMRTMLEKSLGYELCGIIMLSHGSGDHRRAAYEKPV